MASISSDTVLLRTTGETCVNQRYLPMMSFTTARDSSLRAIHLQKLTLMRTMRYPSKALTSYGPPISAKIFASRSAINSSSGTSMILSSRLYIGICQ